MPSENVTKLNQIDERIRFERHEANTKNTVMRQQLAQLDVDYGNAVRSGNRDKAADIRAQMEQLKVDIEYHDKDRQALEHAKLDDPESIALAKAAHGEIKQGMDKLRVDWNKKKTVIREAMDTLIKTVEELGALAAKGDKLKAQIDYVVDVTGLNMVYIQHPAEVDVNMLRQQGIIYPDIKAIEAAYQKGKRS